MPPGVYARPSLQERFNSKWIPEPNSGCWIWMACLSRTGYGTFTPNQGGIKYAHRIAYELTKGPIPPGLTLDHLCRNRACVNPDHLEAVTMRENTLRGKGPAAINATKTHCKYGHEFSEWNTYRDRQNRRYCRICESRKHRQQNEEAKWKRQQKDRSK